LESEDIGRTGKKSQFELDAHHKEETEAVTCSFRLLEFQGETSYQTSICYYFVKGLASASASSKKLIEDMRPDSYTRASSQSKGVPRPIESR